MLLLFSFSEKIVELTNESSKYKSNLAVNIENIRQLKENSQNTVKNITLLNFIS